MRIAISSQGDSFDSPMDQRFGRAGWFILVDPESMNFEALDNGASTAGGGAGISTAQSLIDRGIDTVITGNVGPNAMNVLKAAGIVIYRGKAVSAKENMALFKKDALEKIIDTVPAHSGMGGR